MKHSLTKNWEKHSKLTLKKEFKNFEEVVNKVLLIKKAAEKLNHHPNLKIYDYNKLEIQIYTHRTDDLTDKDYELAKKIEEII